MAMENTNELHLCNYKVTYDATADFSLKSPQPRDGCGAGNAVKIIAESHNLAPGRAGGAVESIPYNARSAHRLQKITQKNYN